MQNAVSSDVLTTPATIANSYSYQSKKLGGGVVWLAVMTVLMFFVGFTPNAQGQTSCEPEVADPGCVWTGWVEVDPQSSQAACTTLVINGSSCQVCFGFRYRRCGDVFEVDVNGFATAEPCLSYMKSLAHGTLADKLLWKSIVNSLYAVGDLPAAKAFYENVMRNGNSGYNCTGPTGCNSSIGSHIVYSTVASCIEYIDVDGGSVGSGCVGSTRRVACASTYCCFKSWQMCYDAVAGQVRTCNPTSGVLGSTPPACSGSASYTPPSGCSIGYRTGCFTQECSQ